MSPGPELVKEFRSGDVVCCDISTSQKTAEDVRKALVSIGGGKVALFHSQAEPPKAPRVRLDPKPLPDNWKRRRERLLARK